MSAAESSGLLEPIAVIGMACRVPGANDVDAFWRNLSEGVESITFFADEELLAAGVPPALLANPSYVKAGAVIDGIDEFDAAFFGYSPKEARAMDPQHRIFLELAWEAMERAGCAPGPTRRRTGVFAGVGQNTYLLNVLAANRAFLESLDPMQSLICTDKDFLTTRVSYKLNLTGPSLNVNTACSTSLVAVHLACQSLLSYQCDAALAGGIEIHVPQVTGYLHREGSIMSPDGHCRAFDARAGGTVGGSGAGIVVLKRLGDAIADADTIHAVIKGSAINNDGAFKAGYTTPSVEGEAAVIKEAMALAGFEPETVSFIEAHGTGTAIGDPIEIAALAKVFRNAPPQSCAVGSVKTNVGHLGAAAGVTSLIKAALSIEHGLIPPILHFEKPNPRIRPDGSPFYFNAKPIEWPGGAAPRRAGVSSFGIGGTNAHVVLEEAPALKADGGSSGAGGNKTHVAPEKVPRRESSGPGRELHLITISAKSLPALERATENLAEHFEQNPDMSLADAAYTLQIGRASFGARRIAVCRDAEDAAAALEGIDPHRVSTATLEPGERHVVFMFSGQGAQYAGMGGGLYGTESVFTKEIDACAEILKEHFETDLRELLYPASESDRKAAERLAQTAIAQPALFATEYALGRLWMEWGVRPSAMIGHSIGEYTAACLAGVFSLEDALALVAERGCLMQEMPGGEMMAVGLPAAEIEPMLTRSLSLAAVNGPAFCTVSGEAKEIASLHDRLERMGAKAGRLHTSHAFHSAMMDPILEPFTNRVAEVELHAPKIPFISNLTGNWIEDAEATDPSYWANHLRRTVKFSEGIRAILDGRNALLLEVGPGRTLSTLAMQHRDEFHGMIALSSLPHPKDRTPDPEFLLNTVGKMWVNGASIDWRRFHEGEVRQRIPLPTYPFERTRFWVEAKETTDTADGSRDGAGIDKDPDISNWFYAPSWRRTSPLTGPHEGAKIESPCLFFNDESPLGESLIAHLRKRGCDVVAVKMGDQFAGRDNNTYTIDASSREDYETLFDDLIRTGSAPRTIIHLWSTKAEEDRLRASGGPDDLYAEFDDIQAAGLRSLVYLARAAGARLTDGTISLCAVSVAIHNVTGDERIRPAAAALTAAVRTIPQEYPRIRCRSIDIGGIELNAETAFVANRTAETLIGEIASPERDTIVAYRNGYRWVQSFEPVRLDGRFSLLRRGGVYLITGGFGRIGSALARHLASDWNAKLVLTGRTELPPRSEWEKLLAGDEDGAGVPRCIRTIVELEDLSAEVIAARADVADYDRMEQCVREVEERFGRLNGVFHCAGIVADDAMPPLHEIDSNSFALHAMSKVRGTLVLDRLLRERGADFCVLQSSISTILGGLGFTTYAAANRFMDAFAEARAGREDMHRIDSSSGIRARRDDTHGTPPSSGGAPYTETIWLAVDWDGWLFPNDDSKKEPLRREGQSSPARLAMSPEEGMKAFEKILTRHGYPRVIVSTADLGRRLDRWVNLAPLRERKRKGETAGARGTVDRSAPRTVIEEEIARVWCEVLGYETVGAADDFFEIGGTSLHAIQLMPRLEELFGTPLSVDVIFEAPTLGQLASRIAELRRERDTRPGTTPKEPENDEE